VGFEGQNFPGHGGGGFRYPEYQAYLAERGYEHHVTRVDDCPIPVMRYGVLEGPVESTVPYFLSENTIDMIDRFAASGEPFFIWHSFWGPHAPYYSPRAFYEAYRDAEIPEWPNYRWPSREINRPHQVKVHPQAEQLAWEDWAEGVRHYYAFATLIDAQIGRVIDHLERTGLSENTIVIFAADHGETLGSHGGLTDKGWHHFEEIQRIPFIVWAPERFYQGAVDPGEVRREWVSLADVYPTVLDLAGVPYEHETVHGRSLVPLLSEQAEPWRDQILVEFNGVNSISTSMVSVRVGDLKYGWNGPNLDELYDLGDDPFEMHNLIDDPARAGQVREMRERVGRWMEETGYPGIGMYRQSRLGAYWI
jgi:arylsulfatase A-like enzyme